MRDTGHLEAAQAHHECLGLGRNHGSMSEVKRSL